MTEENKKSLDEYIQQNRDQLEEWTRKTLAEIEKKDQYPKNLNLIVQYASAVFQFATVIDRQEKQKKGVKVLDE